MPLILKLMNSHLVMSLNSNETFIVFNSQKASVDTYAIQENSPNESSVNNLAKLLQFPRNMNCLIIPMVNLVLEKFALAFS